MSTASVRPDDTIPALGDAPEPRPPAGPLGDVGPYELLTELAQGGMGRVYLARERGESGFTRLVALKRIHDHLAREKAFVHMFLDEARIASRIQHPHVCTVFDFGRADDAYFIAMEYLRGLPLSEVLRELGTRPPSASTQRYAIAAHLLSQACEGLHAAHELRDSDGKLLQVVHRDVSPHNLFVGFDGTLRVLDFGIARAVDRISESTTGRVKGKFAYMAPEQALGRPVDRRADVFSVGVVLWELCTLERLFKRDSPAETVLNLVHETTPRPTERVADVPPELERIAMRALAKDPDERYPTARQMGRALARAAAAIGPPVTAGDIAEFMEQLFPGAPERSQNLLETHAADSDRRPAEVTGFRAKATPASLLDRKGRRGVPAVLAVSLSVVAAAGAFAIARLTQPDSPTAMLPASLVDPVREDVVPPRTPTAPPEPAAPEPDDAVDLAFDEAVLEEPADLVFDEPVDPSLDAAGEEDPASPRRRASRRVAPAPVAPTATGEVRVSGPPELWDAPIVFRGRRLGTLPGTVQLPLGRQTIEIRANGQAPIRREVDVRAGQVTPVTVR
ncbi:MAG: serine/threonine protein kinase [Sandaracinaceae bacterium]|nr:serine/threonine protein kinase [Sandaracinaceae bacterium]